MKKMKLFYSKHSVNIQKRLIYQQTTPNENQSLNTDANLTEVSKTAEKSYRDRLMLKGKLEEVVEPISKEKQAWEKLIEQLRNEVKRSPTPKPVQGNFECFDKTVTVVVTPNGEDFPPHQSYVDGKLLEEGFISWALKNKKTK